MCGIFGCVLKEGNAAPLIHSSLKRLEYRGYDSVGIATISEGKIYLKKDQGKIDEVHKLLNLDDMPGSIGIGHTRWATHGAPLKVNAHPHSDCTGQIMVVHNGIIENFMELKSELQSLDHTFVSKTDTEVMPHLIEQTLKQNPTCPLSRQCRRASSALKAPTPSPSSPPRTRQNCLRQKRKPAGHRRQRQRRLLRL